jgi:hypothetical protein
MMGRSSRDIVWSGNLTVLRAELTKDRK